MFKKALAILAATALLILGVVFSAVILFVLVALGLVLWGYLWWKTRKLREEVRKRADQGQVIEGEAIVIEEDTGKTKIDRPGG